MGVLTQMSTMVQFGVLFQLLNEICVFHDKRSPAPLFLSKNSRIAKTNVFSRDSRRARALTFSPPALESRSHAQHRRRSVAEGDGGASLSAPLPGGGDSLVVCGAPANHSVSRRKDLCDPGQSESENSRCRVRHRSESQDARPLWERRRRRHLSPSHRFLSRAWFGFGQTRSHRGAAIRKRFFRSRYCTRRR